MSERIALPDPDAGIETAAAIMRAYLLQRDGRVPLALLNQRFRLTGAPWGGALALLIVRRLVTVDRGGSVWLADPHAEEHTPLRLRVELREDEERGDLPASGRVSAHRSDLERALVDGMELLLHLPGSRIALMPLPEPGTDHELRVHVARGGAR